MLTIIRILEAVLQAETEAEVLETAGLQAEILALLLNGTQAIITDSEFLLL